MIIYNVNEPITGFVPVPRINSLSDIDCIELIDNLEQAMEKAEFNGDGMIASGLADDLIDIKRSFLVRYVTGLSSGTIAGIIGNARYSQIDKAICSVVDYLNRCDDSDIIPLPYDGDGIRQLVRDCYTGVLKAY